MSEQVLQMGRFVSLTWVKGNAAGGIAVHTGGS
jgi:hypothetical protein